MNHCIVQCQHCFTHDVSVVPFGSFLFDDVFERINSRSGFLYAVNEYSAAYPLGDNAEAEEIVPLHAVEPEEEYQPHSAELYEGSLDEKPPEDFKVVAVEPKDVATKPEASTLSTHKLFIDTTVFQHIDTHALEVWFLSHLFIRFCSLL